MTSQAGNKVTENATPGDRPADALPRGLGDAYGFAVFNGLSSQLLLNGPIILYARELGAGATLLGLISGMMPLLVMLQMVGARGLLTHGYRTFMLAGWASRIAFVVLLAVVPLLPGLSQSFQLWTIVGLMFAFNLCRGLTSGAWLPWIAELVPVSWRGRYLTYEQICVNLAGAVAFLLGAFVLHGQRGHLGFATVFGFSALMGVISLVFLRRMPDVPVPEAEKQARGPVPWRALANHPPFRRILHLNVAWAFAYGGLLTFIAAYLRAEGGLSDGQVMISLTAFFVGGVLAGWVAGSRLDRYGSRPMLGLTMAMSALFCLGWFAQACGWWRPQLGIALVLLGGIGLTNSLFNACVNRLAMMVVPKMGRSHFFALFSVVLNVSLGLAPILWGLLIDAIGTRRWVTGPVTWNRYSIFFALMIAAFGWAWREVFRLAELRTRGLDDLLYELLVEDPKRAISRLLPR